MKYQVVIEYDPQTRSYCATVPGLPIIVDADDEREAIQMAREAIVMHFEDIRGQAHPPRLDRPGHAKVVTVEVDASASR